MVNGTALITGMYPGKSGIIANHEYRPEIDRKHPIDVEIPAVVEKGDQLSGGKYISFPTIAELAQKTGGRTAIAAAKTVGLLLDRQVVARSDNVNGSASPLTEGERTEVRGSATPTTGNATEAQESGVWHKRRYNLRRERRANSGKEAEINSQSATNSVTLFAGKSLPEEIFHSITEKLGPFPSAHLQQDVWTTKALTEFLWKEGVPAFSVLWLGEPDLTQHESAPGSPSALAAIKSADENLAAVLLSLDQKGVRQTTNVFVVSDHGFSTIKRSVDLRKILRDAGFSAQIEFNDEPKRGDVMLVGNGGSVLFYVEGHDAEVARRLVEFLQQTDFAGVIFTKELMPGTFNLSEAEIDCRHAPDVVMVFRWNEEKNQFGIPGMIDADWQRGAGKGTHVTLSRFDMHNTLIAAGPDFCRGEIDDLPSGNVDLAPTILRILGIAVPQQLDGRILSEAMTNIDAPTLKPETKTIEAAKDFGSGAWRQSLQISRVGSTEYVDEGNGSFVATESRK
jgi:arylsulfatase A-like enzyme